MQPSRAPRPPGLLRFVTCGSVDDGKSTLIGRLLWDSKVLFEDHLAALRIDSRKYGTQGNDIDLALLVDGLQAEREQGITIDVAYRFFATPGRRFIIADAPGHEQYTANMATAASNADVAIVLIDARKGVLVQTRRHSRIVDLMGIRRIVVAVNKMDLIAWDPGAFERITREFGEFSESLRFDQIQFLPLSALLGDNVLARSPNSPWYAGPTLLEFLETVDAGEEKNGQFRMPVQWVNHPRSDFRGFSGRIAAGQIRPGERVRVSPSGIETQIASIVTMEGALGECRSGQSVTLTMTDEIDISRGDVISAAESPVESSDQFRARLLWMSPQNLIAGREYKMKIHHRLAVATVSEIRHQIDVNSGARLAAKSIGRNDIAIVNLSLDRPVPFEPYDVSRRLGAFILIDRLSGETAGAGMIEFALRRAANIQWQTVDVTREAREGIKGQRARCFWFTGLSGSGKSTIANLLEKRLHAAGLHTYVLEGDNVRLGLNRDLGFTEPDRVENIRRLAEVARLMVDAGLIVCVSAISPFRSDRAFARRLFPPGYFVEVFVDTPFATCEGRDPKGLYARARAGEIANFTGIDSPYEAPDDPDVHIRTTDLPADQAAELLAAYATAPGGERRDIR